MLDIEELISFLISQEDRDCEDDDIDVLSAKYDIAPEIYNKAVEHFGIEL